MQYFLDTASLEDISYWLTLGLVDGITTNPIILAKTGVDPIDRLHDIFSICDVPVSVQLTATDLKGMICQAEKLASLSSNVVIKIPACPVGIKVASHLKSNGIKTNITLIFHPSQALPFIHMDVDYVSLFVAVSEDAGLKQDSTIVSLRETIDSVGSTSQLLCCSLRAPETLWRAVASNAHVVTVPPQCWEEVYRNPFFVTWSQRFEEQWQQLPEKNRSIYDGYADS